MCKGEWRGVLKGSERPEAGCLVEFYRLSLPPKSKQMDNLRSKKDILHHRI